MISVFRILAIAAALVCSHAALAQSARPSPPVSDWAVSYGGAVVSGPRYPGAGSQRFLLIPTLDARYKDVFFISPLRGVGAEASVASGLKVSAALAYDFTSRREKDAARLMGLGDVKSAAALSFELNYNGDDVFAKATLRNRLGTQNGRGATLDTDLGYRLVKSPSGVVSAGLNIKTMDGTYAQNFFGVSAQQSTASKLPAFSAQGGLQSAGVFGQAFYRIDNDWRLFGRLNLYQLAGDAATSPITERKNQVGLVLSLTRNF